jgi:hypothetical protein
MVTRICRILSATSSSWWLLAVPVLMMTSFVGCLAPWIDSAPSRPERHTLVREQLVIHSDFPFPRTHQLLDDLVRLRTDVARQLRLPPSERPIHIYVFEDAERFQRHMELNYPGLSSRRALFVNSSDQLLVLTQWGDRVAEDLRHEVAHGYLHAVIPSIPLWLDEGLAEYFEVPRTERGRNLPHIELLWELQQDPEWQPRLERLEQLDELAQMRQVDYAESWLWTHYLLETTPARRTLLQEYLGSLRDATVTEPLSDRMNSMDEDAREGVRRHLSDLALGVPETGGQENVIPELPAGEGSIPERPDTSALPARYQLSSPPSELVKGQRDGGYPTPFLRTLHPTARLRADGWLYYAGRAIGGVLGRGVRPGE